MVLFELGKNFFSDIKIYAADIQVVFKRMRKSKPHSQVNNLFERSGFKM